MNRILVVDDDLSMREFLELMLAREGYHVDTAPDGREALARAAADSYDLIITDIRMKDVDGIEVLKGIKASRPETVVVLISAFASVETAVTAMKEGAYDFIPKPFRIEELKKVIRNALDLRTPEAHSRFLGEKVKEGCQFGSLVGAAPCMTRVYDLVRRAAQTATNIIITGESGTGKELVARAIHDNSPRAGQKFVAVNCGGMPEQLIESELFGHRKGAFTGATEDKPGLFEVAHKGTLFLDELAELSTSMQVKLLRVVQDKTYRAVGGTVEKKADTRLIAATNKDLETEVMAGRFREDLYYRLNVINIHMPPLRDRRDDIPLLAQYFLEKYSREQGKDVIKMSSYALDILTRYHFPGNVRELENIIERSVALEQSNIVLPESLTLASFKHSRQLPGPARGAETAGEPDTADDRSLLDQQLAVLEKRLLLQALVQAKGVRQDAADLLQATPRSLRYRLVKHNLTELSEKEAAAELEKTADSAPAGPLNPEWTSVGLDLDVIMMDAEKHLLQDALEQCGGSRSRVAQLLGITARSPALPSVKIRRRS